MLPVLAAALTLLAACAHKENKESFDDFQKKDFAENLRKAQAGDVSAMYQVGQAYERGWGTPADGAKALEWYGKAVDKGDGSAMFNIGGMYREGRGVPKDLEQCLAWYLKAANAGEGVAWYNLGMMYYQGDEIQRNDVEALKWLENYVAASGPNDPLGKTARESIAAIHARQ